ncbi:penicillin-binding transpeptidase domain-containing protein [Clostridium butyricum]|uniref:penicillin-binding transpeptidase domain-containing protein n=1 Tax=Clostridium TaxID=1485 RepID=UPI00257F83EE|nr:penicillin-binding transpeptidase domain-containing protein [Clostridium sp.]MBS4841181.1 penicillin-binding protein [Clostridium sp.]MDU1604431.1 penicillin-binding transpeptidase domain-containing protein [Clostridium sp.]MDU2896083.1 penicillin-binding transpeptidase domain-containing protein [Clostridium sp.]MDU3008408.1 penicillin-binding transpeptidase domain-containing protein [Clostridium sp.]MDU3038344.1 penicillin-binding transpeptidase domain-containing protein [Clostridium sp.]
MIVNKPVKKKKISRYTVLCIIMGIIFGAITLRLLYLQVFSYEEYKEKANTTSTRFVSESAPRGEIYDSNGVTLATNVRTYSLTYTETDVTQKNFYSTMSELFKILDESNENIQDTMLLKVKDDGTMYFDYLSSDKDSQNYSELRFKKDRGFNEPIQNKLFPEITEFSDEQTNKINEELLKITPEESFYMLVKNYNLIELIDPEYNSTKEKKEAYKNMTGEEITQKILDAGYSLNDLRKYMLVKDTIKIQSLKGYKSVTIASNIKKDTVLIIKQKLNDMPGIDVSSVLIRDYPYNNLASSVLGYVSTINSAEEEKYSMRGYDVSTDLIGKAGIESAFEEQLKAVKGGKTVKVNSSGRVTEKLFELESYPGNNVHLTIDSNMQYVAEQALADGIKEIQQNPSGEYKNATRGALVAVDVKSGKILSLVSYPDYNPNLFTIPGTLTAEESKQYFNPDLEAFGQELITRMNLNKTVDQLFPKDSKGVRQDDNDLYPKPFYNYATMSLIPPGSIFKPLTSIAGLESGVITPSERINDTGVFNIHPDVFGKSFGPQCLQYTNYHVGHGPLDVTGALEVSCNFFFYETAYRLYMLNGGDLNALDSLAKYAWRFGLGVNPNGNEKASTGIEIQERFGQTYNFSSWKNQIVNYAKYSIVDDLENGRYSGNGTTFVKFDIKYLEDDNEQVRKAKQSIKDKIADALTKVGTDEFKGIDYNQFSKDIKKDVQIIMDNSDRYKQNVLQYEADNNKAINLESQANTIADVITRFTLNDKSVEITSPAQLINASIGQGMNNYTPLQLVSYISTLANGGTRYKLHLVDKITDNEGNVVQQYNSEVLEQLNLNKETIDAVKLGMSKVNNDDSGTAASKWQGFPITTGGKTGTADFAENQKERGRAPYATYVSFAPLDDPEIAVVAVVFDGGHGGSIAGAVRAVFEEYFKDRILAGDPNYASKSESFRKYVLGNPLTKNKENSTENNTNTANTNTGENNSSNNSTNNSQSNSATGNIQNQTVPATD